MPGARLNEQMIVELMHLEFEGSVIDHFEKFYQAIEKKTVQIISYFLLNQSFKTSKQANFISPIFSFLFFSFLFKKTAKFLVEA